MLREVSLDFRTTFFQDSFREDANRLLQGESSLATSSKGIWDDRVKSDQAEL